MVRRKVFSLLYTLIIFTFVQISYQQLTKDLSFCIENHTMSNTLQTFWHDANTDCEMDANRFIELYNELILKAEANKDQCAALLKHQIRKKLINVMTEKLQEALIIRSLQTNKELTNNLKQIQEIDKRVSQFIWAKAIDEVYLFMDTKEIIDEVVQLKEDEIQIIVLQYLINKYLLDVEKSETFLPLLTFYVSTIAKDFNMLSKGFQRVYHRLPQELRLLYESIKLPIGLLNYRHSEYLYAPRDNGPDSERRLALTWSQNKNSTDSDGHLLVIFNPEGLVAFGSRYGVAAKYLYADLEHQAAYFWLGSGSKASQWWQVIWPHLSFTPEHSNYLIFQNDDTKHLLCATAEYDENRRYVTLLNRKDNMENSACHWLVTRF